MNLVGKITGGLAVAALAGCAVQRSAEAPARAAASGIYPAHTVLALTSPELLAAVRRGPAFPIAGLRPAAGCGWPGNPARPPA